MKVSKHESCTGEYLPFNFIFSKYYLAPECYFSCSSLVLKKNVKLFLKEKKINLQLNFCLKKNLFRTGKKTKDGRRLWKCLWLAVDLFPPLQWRPPSIYIFFMWGRCLQSASSRRSLFASPTGFVGPSRGRVLAHFAANHLHFTRLNYRPCLSGRELISWVENQVGRQRRYRALAQSRGVAVKWT